MRSTVVPFKITFNHGGVGEFFKAYFTLGAYRMKESVGIECGNCRAFFTKLVKPGNCYSVCPVCDVANIWRE